MNHSNNIHLPPGLIGLLLFLAAPLLVFQVVQYETGKNPYFSYQYPRRAGETFLAASASGDSYGPWTFYPGGGQIAHHITTRQGTYVSRGLSSGTIHNYDTSEETYPPSTHTAESDLHDENSVTYRQNGDTHQLNSDYHRRSSDSHTGGSSWHLSNTDSHTGISVTHAANTDSHEADTATHSNSTTLHTANTDSHSGDSLTHIGNPDSHAPDTTTHLNSTTLHNPVTETHLPDTNFHGIFTEYYRWEVTPKGLIKIPLKLTPQSSGGQNE